jgi:hypothetical protein
MAILLRLVIVLALAGGVSFGMEDCQPCDDPSQLFCP